jgi:polyhydroxyalkanoate synthesis regulator protein
MSMNNFAQQQEEFRSRMAEAMTNPPASMAMLEDQTRRNMEMFGQAMRMFTPFAAGGAPEPGAEAASPAAATEDKSDVDAMRAELDAMKAKLDKLADS